MPLSDEVDWAAAQNYRLPVVWRRRLLGGFKARVRGQNWVLRLNNFPDEPLFSLFINGRHVLDSSEWPPEWRKPWSRR